MITRKRTVIIEIPPFQVMAVESKSCHSFWNTDIVTSAPRLQAHANRFLRYCLMDENCWTVAWNMCSSLMMKISKLYLHIWIWFLCATANEDLSKPASSKIDSSLTLLIEEIQTKHPCNTVANQRGLTWISSYVNIQFALHSDVCYFGVDVPVVIDFRHWWL